MQLRNTQQHWGMVAVALHWITALVVLAQFILGLWMVELDYYDAWYYRAPYIHKSTGVLLFMLTMFRLGWRWCNQTPEVLAGHSGFEVKAAYILHIALYLLLCFIMISGYLISTADGRSLEVFGWFEVPASLYGLDKQEDIAGVIHFMLAIILILLVMLHAAVAARHHVKDRDRTLLRMLGR